MNYLDFKVIMYKIKLKTTAFKFYTDHIFLLLGYKRAELGIASFSAPTKGGGMDPSASR